MRYGFFYLPSASLNVNVYSKFSSELRGTYEEEPAVKFSGRPTEQFFRKVRHRRKALCSDTFRPTYPTVRKHPKLRNTLSDCPKERPELRNALSGVSEWAERPNGATRASGLAEEAAVDGDSELLRMFRNAPKCYVRVSGLSGTFPDTRRAVS